jgi:hypothetical protein
LAIPRERGGYYFVIYITSNQLGYAFGIFEGYRQVPYVSSTWAPIPTKYPVYSGRGFVVSGRWRHVGRRDDLLKLFPKSPEIYHSKMDTLTNDEIGPFGSAESIAGELRTLTESEALEVGLMQGTYRQIMVEEQFEKYLNEHLK